MLLLRESYCFWPEQTGPGFVYVDKLQPSLYHITGLGLIDEKNIRN